MATTPRNSGNDSTRTPRDPQKVEFTTIFLGRPVTDGEYEEICRNLGEFFTLLSKWAKEGRQS